MAYEDAPDDLDVFIAERAVKNPAFPELMAAARRQRLLLRALAEKREEPGFSQTAVAARMGTSQSTLACLEQGNATPTLRKLRGWQKRWGRR